jgi:bacterioferritin-associated ferredoxin
MVDVDLCKGCMNCVFVCPGLAVTLVDYRKDPDHPVVTLPYEIWRKNVEVGQKVPVTDLGGRILGYYPVEKVVANKKKYPGTLLVQVKIEKPVAKKTVGILVQEERIDPSLVYEKALPPDEAIICRCERVTAGEIRTAIRDGVRDINQLKALTRAGKGACGSKTCRPMIWRIFEEEGVDLAEVTDRIDRPLFVEVSLGVLAGMRNQDGNEEKESVGMEE